ncbi:MAG: OmpH/Skp family outer membrane protein [Planctomycetota bacterium]
MSVKKVIDGYTKTLAMENRIDKIREERLEAIAERKKKIEGMRKQLEGVDRGSAEYHRQWDAILKEEALVKCEEAGLKREVQFNLLKATREIYEDIAEFCVELRKREGYAAILKMEGPGMDSESKAELILKINTRSVLACDPGLDVTEKVIVGLNEKAK